MTDVLAGDVGGTKTVLCLYRVDDSRPGKPVLTEVHKALYSSTAHAGFAELMAAFLNELAPLRPSAACLGIAGPVQGRRCDATNLPWVIDADRLARDFAIDDVFLLNDLEAAAHGMLQLADDEFVELNPDAERQPGHAAVIAAGTGLGEAILAWDGRRHIVLPSEGGHADFGPNCEQEDALLGYLRERFGGHVSNERILSGAGFGHLYDFLCASGYARPDPAIEAEMAAGDRNAVISRHGLEGHDALCTEAVRLFVRIYGREAGNLALRCLPRGGVFIGGGIGPKIRDALQSGEFIRGFLDKGRMASAIKHIPLRLSLNPEAPLLGAAHMAVRFALP
jgi:glucokinase